MAVIYMYATDLDASMVDLFVGNGTANSVIGLREKNLMMLTKPAIFNLIELPCFAHL